MDSKRSIAASPDADFSSVGALLLVSIGLTITLFFLPRWIPSLYKLSLPLMWLSTMVHEMGHGFAAILVGGEFKEFKMWSNGSGVAPVGGLGGNVSWAIVSAGGLVGPAVGAALGFVFARHAKSARIYVGATGLVLALAEILWVRTPFALVFVGCVAAVCIAVAVQPRKQLAQLFLLFLSVQLALSVYSRGDYLFSESANTGAGTFPSDVSNMATALGGPYWLWGAICALFSVLVLLFGIYLLLWRPKHARA